MTATILAIDSAIDISSVAIWNGGNVAVYLEDREYSKQSARLIPLIEKALKKANLQYSALTHVVSTVGPGSFTGIRIGLATARGIAFAMSIPCLGFTTLEVMHAAGGELCILNAGKGEVYYQYFGPAATEPAIAKLEDILACYPNATIVSSVGATAIAYPRADALAHLAATKMQKARPPSPFYIRPPDAKPPQHKVSDIAQVT